MRILLSESTQPLFDRVVAAEKRLLERMGQILVLQSGGIAQMPPNVPDAVQWMLVTASALERAADEVEEYSGALRKLADHWTVEP